MALIMMVNAIFLNIKRHTKISQLGNVKESVLKLRRFAFDLIFSIKISY